MSNSENKNTSGVTDLRSAIELLKTLPGEYVETDTEVDPHAELPVFTVTLARAAPASAQHVKTAR